MHTFLTFVSLLLFSMFLCVKKMRMESCLTGQPSNPLASNYDYHHIHVLFKFCAGNAIRRHTVGRFPAIRKSGNWRQLGGDFTPIGETIRRA
jgi:hypothetical protein